MKKILLTMGIGAFLSAAVAQDITSNLEAYISFDAGTAIIDDGAATVAGTNNGATPVDDRQGNSESAMYFDGNDWIDFGNYTNYQFGNSSFTIACWIKADLTGNTGYVIGKRGFTSGLDRVYALTYNYTGGGQVFGYLRDDNALAAQSYPTASVAAGEWHHVAMVIDRSVNMAGFYIDGVAVSATPLGNGFTTFNANGTSFGNLVMGRSSNGDQYFRGVVDEMYIFRRALAPADIAALVGPQPINLTTGLVFDLPFCDGSITDETGNVMMSSYFDGTTPTTDRNNESDAARQFTTGSQSFMELPNNLVTNSDFTISVWYYYTGSPSQYPRLVDLSKQLGSVSDAIILYPSNGGNNIPYFGMWNASGSLQVSLNGTAGDVSINEWTHVVVSKSGGIYSMYINGQLATAVSNNFVPANVNRIVSRLGRSAYPAGDFFGGTIDDFKIWHRGLNATEVDALYNANDPCTGQPPCDVYIPDAVFKSILVNNSAINTNQDSEIQCYEAAAFTGFIDLSNSAVTDLTGLEAFTAAQQLSISGSSVTSFDISANTALTYFNCSVLGLTGTLGFSSANSALQDVFVGGNQLSGVDVSALANLEHLDCAYNNISVLDLNANPELRILAADGNALTSLDLSNNPLLTDLSVSSNGIVSLDVSGNSNLVTINVQGNVPMVYLNVANGNNTNFTFYNSFNNPNLGCIQVDDVAYSVANWTNVHPFSSFNTFCTPPIAVGVVEQEATNLNIYPNPTESLLFFSEAIAGEVLDMTGKSLIQFPITRTLDLSRLADGIYLIRTTGGAVNRIVKN